MKLRSGTGEMVGTHSDEPADAGKAATPAGGLRVLARASDDRVREAGEVDVDLERCVELCRMVLAGPEALSAGASCEPEGGSAAGGSAAGGSAAAAVVEVCVSFVDTAAMAELNGRHMGGDGPTDVLAFPIDALPAAPPGVPEPAPCLLGDVVVCPSVAAANVAGADPVAAEIDLLVVHGLLHLLGMDHAGDDEAAAMFEAQARHLEEFWRVRAPGSPADRAGSR